MISDGDVVQLLFLSRCGDVLKSRGTVTPVGVNVQISLHLIIAHNFGERILKCCLNLSSVLSELRFNVAEATGVIDRLLGVPSYRLVALSLEEAVFIEFVA